ncbi:predicted protein [Botrytis cinerea T4]|uniref:Uncharacterized protein n=1 Tax=Botryotinia fuckeliana (strain T4) TaxID=999810 RepID=G2Y7T8_BOTF4|nr:predicted protein [Botrytis cinerea T4]
MIGESYEHPQRVELLVGDCRNRNITRKTSEAVGATRAEDLQMAN